MAQNPAKSKNDFVKNFVDTPKRKINKKEIKVVRMIRGKK